MVRALDRALILRGVHAHGTLFRDDCLIILPGKMLIHSPEGNLLVQDLFIIMIGAASSSKR